MIFATCIVCPRSTRASTQREECLGGLFREELEQRRRALDAVGGARDPQEGPDRERAAPRKDDIPLSNFFETSTRKKRGKTFLKSNTCQTSEASFSVYRSRFLQPTTSVHLQHFSR